MSGNITLHKTLGVNPRMTFCPRCGGESNELVLLGANNFKDICNKCGLVGYGGFDRKHGHRECPRCQGTEYHREEMEEYEKCPASQPCDACQKQMAEYKAIVLAGGVYFRCAKCGCKGVFKGHTELAKDTRSTFQAQDAATLAKGWYTESIHTVDGAQVYLECGVELDDCKYHTVTPDPKET